MTFVKVVQVPYLGHIITVYESSGKLAILTSEIGTVIGINDVSARVKGDDKIKEKIQGESRYKTALTRAGIDALRSNTKSDKMPAFYTWVMSTLDEILAARIRAIKDRDVIAPISEQAPVEVVDVAVVKPVIAGDSTDQSLVIMEEFKKISLGEATIAVYGSIDHPLFLASEVGDAIGVIDVNSSIRNYRDDERVLRKTHTNGGVQECIFLTELGFVSLCFKVRTPTARPFCMWVVRVLREVTTKGYFINDTQLEQQLQEKLEARIRDEFDVKYKQQYEEQLALQLKTHISPQSTCQTSQPVNSSPKNKAPTPGQRKSLTLPPQMDLLPTTEPPVFGGDISDYCGPCVYVLHLQGWYHKYGITKKVWKRVGQHENLFGKLNITPTIIMLYKCNTIDAASAVEKRIKLYSRQHKFNVEGCGQREIISTGDINPLLAVIPRYIEEENARVLARLSINIESERVQLAKLELHRTDAQLKIEEAKALQLQCQLKLANTHQVVSPQNIPQAIPNMQRRSTVDHHPAPVQQVVYQDNIAPSESTPVIITHPQAPKPSQPEPIVPVVQSNKQSSKIIPALLPAADFSAITKVYVHGERWVGTYEGYDVRGHGPSCINVSRFCRTVSKNDAHYIHKWFLRTDTDALIAQVSMLSGLPISTLHYRLDPIGRNKREEVYMHYVLLPYLMTWLQSPP